MGEDPSSPSLDAGNDKAAGQKAPRRPRKRRASARSLARRAACQALYQQFLTGDHARDLIAQFSDFPGLDRVDEELFREVLMGVETHREALDEMIEERADRPVDQLDPIEHAVLLIGLYELRERIETPYRVVLNEALELAHEFGGEDGHKFVNALLDKASLTLRKVERAR
ncbi:MAG: transcription antitermination factor NusB [Pseudomonadota bacterium]